jgi:putative flippase GtrA
VIPASFGRFLTVGILNSIVGLLTIYFCMWVLSFRPIVANAIGYAIGLMLSFSLNKDWTFRYDGAVTPALARFALVVVTAYLANLATVYVATEVLAMNPYVAQAIGIIPYTLLSYIGSRFFAFHWSQ